MNKSVSDSELRNVYASHFMVWIKCGEKLIRRLDTLLISVYFDCRNLRFKDYVNSIVAAKFSRNRAENINKEL